MKTIKPVIAPFMALVLALFFAVVPAQATSLVNGGYHDDGVGGDGNHYFEVYWYASDTNIDCDPYSGTDGTLDVSFASAYKLSGGSWVLASDVNQSYAGVSGFSHHECQVNVYAPNGAGQRSMNFGWSINGVVQSGQGNIVLTF